MALATGSWSRAAMALYHIDLLLVRARLHLLRGDARAALRDIEVALGDNAGLVRMRIVEKAEG